MSAFKNLVFLISASSLGSAAAYGAPKTLPAPGSDTNDCQQLQQAWGAWQLDGYCNLETATAPSYWVGDVLTDSVKSGVDGRTDYFQYQLTFQNGKTLTIESYLATSPYVVGTFYKFDEALICPLMMSSHSSGSYDDPDLNKLQPISCAK